jgi:serine/threonine protein kinase
MNNIDEMKKECGDKLNNTLLQYGYKFIDLCDNTYKNGKYVYMVSDKDGNKFVCKQYHQCSYSISWKRTKEIHKELEELNIGPKIREFLDKERICVMECGYKTFFHYANNDKVKERVTNMIDVLHENKYIHGDLHEYNIMIREDDTPFLIDFESTIKWGKDDISTVYRSKELSTFEALVKFDLSFF